MKIILTFIVALISTMSINAQSSVRVIDFVVFNANIDSLVQDSIEFQVHFKVNQPENISQIILKLGSEENQSDVKYVQVSVEHDENNHNIIHNGGVYLIEGIHAKFPIFLSENEIGSVNVFTLSIIDSLGNETAHYYFNK